MNEPTQEPNDREFDNEILDSLRRLKPRAPRLDWDAIRAAQSAPDATMPPSSSVPLRFTTTTRIAVAWWSGMAAGVAITFFAMQWFVLRDLRAQVAQFEQTIIASTEKSTEDSLLNERIFASTETSLDLNALLDGPNLSVGSYRGSIDRLVHVRPKFPATESSSVSGIDEATVSNSTTTPRNRDLEIDPEQSTVSRLQLIKDLQREVY